MAFSEYTNLTYDFSRADTNTIFFPFLLRDIRAFSETKEENDMFRLPTELEYVFCWPCNMDVYLYLTCHFFNASIPA